MKPVSGIPILILCLLLATPALSNKSSYAIGYQLGKAFGTGYGALVMFSEIQKECTAMDSRLGARVRQSLNGWYIRNQFYIVRSRAILNEVVRFFHTQLAKAKDPVARTRITRSIAVFKSMDQVMRKRARNLFYRKSRPARMTFCRNMAVNLASPRMDIENRAPQVAAYLKGWTRQKFYSSNGGKSFR